MSVNKVAKDCLKFQFNNFVQTTQPQQKNLNKMHVALNARTLLHSVPLLLKRLMGRLLSVSN